MRVRPASRQLHRIPEVARETPEVVECYRITGEDCFFLKLHLRSIDDLEEILDRFVEFGQTTTSIIHSAPVANRPLPLDVPTRVTRVAIRGILFDLDFTLVDNDVGWRQLWPPVAERFAARYPGFDPDEFQSRSYAFADGHYELLLRGEIDYDTYRRDYVRHGVEPWGELDDELFAAYTDARDALGRPDRAVRRRGRDRPRPARAGPEDRDPHERPVRAPAAQARAGSGSSARSTPSRSRRRSAPASRTRGLRAGGRACSGSSRARWRWSATTS